MTSACLAAVDLCSPTVAAVDSGEPGVALVICYRAVRIIQDMLMNTSHICTIIIYCNHISEH